MADNIPIEMQIEIIKRLPVKSLAVFRSVSKAWKSVIDSRLFIADYSNFHQHHRLLIRYDIVNTYESNYKYVSILDNEYLSQQTVSNVPAVSFQVLKELELVGTSQGLLCLLGKSRELDCDKQAIVIWNPTLGKSIVVDVSFLYPKDLTVFGFGVRPDNCDPMIVMVGNVAHPKPVMVFTLSSRGWRVPRGNLPPKSIYFAIFSRVATHDRCIYWKAHDRSINLVVAFDMVSEDFTELNLPYSVAHRAIGDFSISMIRNSVALLEYYDDAKKPICDVWMMVEDGVSNTFTKLFTINTPDASLKKHILGFSKNDQPIMEKKVGGCWVASLGVYEPSTGAIENVWIIGKPGSFFVSSYRETLLLLDELDEQFVKIQLQF